MKRAAVLLGTALFAIPCISQESAWIANFRQDWNNAKPLSHDGDTKIGDLAPAQRAAIMGAIRLWTRTLSGSTTMEGGDELTTAPLYLDRTGPKMLVVTGTGQFNCSPTGNCSIYVLQPEQKRYRVILDSIGQTLSILPKRTNGYNDLLVPMHGSATETTLKVYKFDGSRYRRERCYNAEFEILDQSGNRKELEDPRITPCGSR